VGDILLSAVKKVKGVGVERAVRVALEVGLGVGEDRVRVALSLVNPGQEDEGVCLAGVEPEGLKGATLRLGDTPERELDEPEAVLADGGRRRDEETSANEGFGLEEVRALIKDHG